MKDLKKQLGGVFKGELDDAAETIEKYSHDASLFEVRPQVVAYPKNAADVQALVKFVAEHKAADPELSITGRSAGTDMSGGAINESIIVDFLRHFSAVKKVSKSSATFEPGVYYRDFEKETLKLGALFPSYPASRDLCAMGGIVNNNAGGEKSLEFGKTEDFVTEIQAVLADGSHVTLKPITKAELDAKMAQTDFEGQVYRETFALVDKHYDEIKAAKPKVSKNSTGYNLWDVWDRDKGIFDLTKLFVGAQGTLGLMTEATLRLVPARKHSGLLVLFLKDIDRLGEVINVVLSHKPATFESFDDVTLKMSIKFMPFFLKMLGWKKFIQLLIGLIPDGFLLLRGIPKLILMVEFNGDSQEEVTERIVSLHKELNLKKKFYEITAEEEDRTEYAAEKFWTMRRQSFNLLRSKVKDKHTAPFIDDLVVPPAYLPDFLPKMRAIIKKYGLFATIAGHMGDGNFHIIPLMKLEDPKEKAKLEPAMKETNDLVLQYRGVLSGEHNDGMIRGPWLEQTYGPEIYGYFRQVKQIFDPQGIFNPHKKANADWDWSMRHVRDHW